MKRTAQTTFAACVLPLLLLAAQGGSCGGGRTAGDGQNQSGNRAGNQADNQAGNRAGNRAGAAHPAGRMPTPDTGTPGPAPAANSATPATGAGGKGAGNANTGGAAGGDTAMEDGLTNQTAGENWGGVGIRLDVKGSAAEVEFDCAHGRLDEFNPGPDGRFSSRGTLVVERGGPARLGEELRSVPATYAGRVSGETMTLRVSAEGTDDTDYTLRRGSAGRLRKCL
ncbi:MAG TPA: hypothetical protein VEY09_15490 [Pyrinomonadaceae bacterium]|nr:hypothetical protein [Pyrinomonadaceae bacterium]